MPIINIVLRPLKDIEIDLLMKDIVYYPDLVYVKKSRFQSYKDAYIVEEGSQFVGICGIYKMKDNWVKLGPLVFLRNHHGKGYGKLLLSKIVSDHTDKNIFITSSNIAVQKIIEKLGFKEVSGYFSLPMIVQLFLIKTFREHLHIKLFTEFFRKLFTMKRNKRKYYIKNSIRHLTK
jgi:RimJ/RimL family protein N-acetyltransferase